MDQDIDVAQSGAREESKAILDNDEGEEEEQDREASGSKHSSYSDHDEESISGNIRRNSKFALSLSQPSTTTNDVPQTWTQKLHLDRSMFSFHDMTDKHKSIFYSRLGDVVIILSVFVTLVFSLGDNFMLLGGPGWSLFLLWFCSLITGIALNKVKIPPLLGNLVVGIILKNVPGKLVDGLPNEWATIIRSTGLTLILMRSGLELDLPAVVRQGWVAARLTVIPGFMEAMVVGGVAVAHWGMPPALGFSLGFILAAVSPAVLIGGMFDLQKHGYGIAKGIPSLLVAAASFDDAVAITGYSIAIGFASFAGGNKVWEALKGPVEMIIGFIVGVTGGILCGMTRMFPSSAQRIWICLFVGFYQSSIAGKFHASGAGAIAGLVTTGTASYIWQNNSLNNYKIFKWLGVAKDQKNHEWHHHTEHTFAMLWDKFLSPLQFGLIGVSIDFSKIDVKIIPGALLIVFCGMLIRVPTAFFCCGGKNLTFWEKLFVGLAWIPKATVQASLGSVPLDLIVATMNKNDKNYELYKSYGEQILLTAVVSILITAPIGLVCINAFGQKWLNNDITNPIHDPEDPEGEKSKSKAKELKYAALNGNDLYLSGAHEDGDSSNTGAGNVNAERQRSFAGVVADYFDKIIRSDANKNTAKGEDVELSPHLTSRIRSASLARRTITAGIIAQAARTEDWVLAEQRKRMSTDDVRALNRRLSAHYFHNLTNHIEFISSSLEAIRHQDSAKIDNGTISATKESYKKREELLTDLLLSTAKIMQGSMACYKVIAGMEEHFPVEKLYSFIGSTEDDLARNAERAVYDYMSGDIAVDTTKSPDTSADSIRETLVVLDRRDTNIWLSPSKSRSNIEVA